VHRLVNRADGAVNVNCSDATTFTVMLPTKAREGVEARA
jgi:hypothetical protein